MAIGIAACHPRIDAPQVGWYRLEGSVTLIKAGGKEQVIPFVATLGGKYRFYAEASTDNADVDRTWDATFTDDKGETSKAILLLEQHHGRGWHRTRTSTASRSRWATRCRR